MRLAKLKTAAENIEEIIRGYLSGRLTDNSFLMKYPIAVERFEEVAEEDVCHPLSLLAPRDSNSERAWRESMIEFSRRHILELEEQIKELDAGKHVESYAEKLGPGELKALCSDALLQIRKQVRDIAIKSWIAENIVEDTTFEFFTQDGKSKFGEFLTLYSTPIFQESFLLSALSNLLARPAHTFQELLATIREVSAAKDCAWAKCSEIDGATVDIRVESSTEGLAFEKLANLSWIERTTNSDTQGGICHLLLMPFPHDWLLKITNDFNTLKIELHGREGFLEGVRSALEKRGNSNAVS